MDWSQRMLQQPAGTLRCNVLAPAKMLHPTAAAATTTTMIERRIRLPLLLFVTLVVLSRISENAVKETLESQAFSSSEWIEVDNIVDTLEPLSPKDNDTATINNVRVWLSSGPCGIVVAVREDGKDSPPPTSAGRCPPSSPFVGLHTSQDTWMYRRAFGGCFDCTNQTWDDQPITALNNTRYACSQSTFAALSDIRPLRPQACSQVSTARAWWLDSKKETYALQLPPFDCTHCLPTISVFGGMDRCQKPLETMGEAELKPPVKDTLGCVFPKRADVRPLASVRVPEELLDTQPELEVRGGRWKEDGSRWEFLPEKDPPSQTSSETNNKQISSNLESLCMIGDSHFQRSSFAIHTMSRELLGFGFGGVKLLINFAVSDGFEAPARHNISVGDDMKYCYDWLRSRSNSTNGTGAIILSLGSHQPRASLENMTRFVHDLEGFVQNQSSQHPVLVSSTLDSCHGNIPKHFHTEQRMGQNTWREEAKAAAVQSAIENSPLENLHYVDLFAPSAALHFGHCLGGDPVHWTGGIFYKEHFRLLFDAAQKTFG